MTHKHLHTQTNRKQCRNNVKFLENEEIVKKSSILN